MKFTSHTLHISLHNCNTYSNILVGRGKRTIQTKTKKNYQSVKSRYSTFRSSYNNNNNIENGQNNDIFAAKQVLLSRKIKFGAEM